jgi:hypothetical protein
MRKKAFVICVYVDEIRNSTFQIRVPEEGMMFLQYSNNTNCVSHSVYMVQNRSLSKFAKDMKRYSIIVRFRARTLLQKGPFSYNNAFLASDIDL